MNCSTADARMAVFHAALDYPFPINCESVLAAQAGYQIGVWAMERVCGIGEIVAFKAEGGHARKREQFRGVRYQP